LIFSVPNTGHYSHRIRLLLGKFPMQWRHHPGEHLRFWCFSDMRWWLMSCLKFKEEKFNIIPYNAPISLLNKIFPSIFSRGILVYVSK